MEKMELVRILEGQEEESIGAGSREECRELMREHSRVGMLRGRVKKARESGGKIKEENIIPLLKQYIGGTRERYRHMSGSKVCAEYEIRHF